jgi:hypothetical protein
MKAVNTPMMPSANKNNGILYPLSGQSDLYTNTEKYVELYDVGTTERDYTKQQQYMLFIQLKYTSMKNDLSEMHEPKNIKYELTSAKPTEERTIIYVRKTQNPSKAICFT